MYCLWEQFGLVDDKRELSLNGMLTFFQRIPAYRAEVQKATSKCKGIGKYLGIYSVFRIFLFFFRSIDYISNSLRSRSLLLPPPNPNKKFVPFGINRTRSIARAATVLLNNQSLSASSLLFFQAKGDNCEYAYVFNKCYAELSPRVSNCTTNNDNPQFHSIDD